MGYKPQLRIFFLFLKVKQHQVLKVLLRKSRFDSLFSVSIMWCRGAWDANAWKQSVKSRAVNDFPSLDWMQSGQGGNCLCQCCATVCRKKVEHKSNTETISKSYLLAWTWVKNKCSSFSETQQHVVSAKCHVLTVSAVSEFTKVSCCWQMYDNFTFCAVSNCKNPKMCLSLQQSTVPKVQTILTLTQFAADFWKSNHLDTNCIVCNDEQQQIFSMFSFFCHHLIS